MQIARSERGFEFLEHEVYPGVDPAEPLERLASQSSAIGDYPDSHERPGSSYLWIGDNHHLDREEVAQFIGYLQRWLDTGKMRVGE